MKRLRYGKGRGCAAVRRRYMSKTDWYGTCKAAVDGTAMAGINGPGSCRGEGKVEA